MVPTASTKVNTATIITLLGTTGTTFLTQAVDLELLPAGAVGVVVTILTFLGARQVPEGNPSPSAYAKMERELRAWQDARDAEAYRGGQATYPSELADNLETRGYKPPPQQLAPWQPPVGQPTDRVERPVQGRPIPPGAGHPAPGSWTTDQETNG